MAERITRRQLLERGAMMSGVFALIDRSDAGSPAPTRRTAGAQTVRPACLQGARIRWIVGWTPGGGFDTYSRLAEPFIEKVLGAQIAIDNIPGAAGRVGALTLSRARPDGRTLGILNGSSFLWERTSSAGPPPDLRRDFTVLARVAGRQQVILASAAAGVRSVDDLVQLSRKRTIVAGITAADSANFASLAIVTDLLGISTEFVAGYPGSREVILGLLRGDADIASVDVETVAQIPDLERAHPVLQITPERSPDPRFRTVPHLAGPTGLQSRRPDLFGGDRDRAHSLSAAISAYLEFGRLIAGPGGMTPTVRGCLDQGLRTALTDPGFVSAARKAGRSVDVTAGADVIREIPTVMTTVQPIAAVATAAARRIR